MVTCVKCRKEKERDFFSLNNKKRNGLQSYCRQCVSENVIKWNRENPARRKELMKRWLEKNLHQKRIKDRERQRKRRAQNPGLKTAEFSKYREKYPEKVSAHRKLNYAINSGKIKRSACEICGEARVHAHHDIYQLPLNVRWLCPVHHKHAHSAQTL